MSTPATPVTGGLTTRALSALTGVSTAMLRYWVEDGRLTPHRDPWGRYLWDDVNVQRAQELAATSRGRRKAVRA